MYKQLNSRIDRKQLKYFFKYNKICSSSQSSIEDVPIRNP